MAVRRSTHVFDTIIVGMYHWYWQACEQHALLLPAGGGRCNVALFLQNAFHMELLLVVG